MSNTTKLRVPLHRTGNRIEDVKGFWLAVMKFQNNCDDLADEIVSRCNAHDELVEALEGLLFTGEHIDLQQGMRMQELFPKKFEAARTALAKARGLSSGGK